jgi:hypothetical protein
VKYDLFGQGSIILACLLGGAMLRSKQAAKQSDLLHLASLPMADAKNQEWAEPIQSVV